PPIGTRPSSWRSASPTTPGTPSRSGRCGRGPDLRIRRRRAGVPGGGRGAGAALARLLGDLGAAEDAVQEAFVEALRTWPERGIPDRPGAWITTTARNRAIDRARREADRGARGQAAAPPSPATPPPEPELEPVDDDQLRLIFTCCHPALAPAAQVGLTLRLLGGLPTAGVARGLPPPGAPGAQ